MVIDKQFAEIYLILKLETIKRFMPKDRGKAYNIMKRTSHLVVEVAEREEKQK